MAKKKRPDADRRERLVAEAARRRADAALFPECAVTGYGYDFSTLSPRNVRNALTSVGEMAARHSTNVLIGSPVFGRGKLYKQAAGATAKFDLPRSPGAR